MGDDARQVNARRPTIKRFQISIQQNGFAFHGNVLDARLCIKYVSFGTCWGLSGGEQAFSISIEEKTDRSETSKHLQLHKDTCLSI